MPYCLKKLCGIDQCNQMLGYRSQKCDARVCETTDQMNIWRPREKRVPEGRTGNCVLNLLSCHQYSKATRAARAMRPTCSYKPPHVPSWLGQSRGHHRCYDARVMLTNVNTQKARRARVRPESPSPRHPYVIMYFVIEQLAAIPLKSM